MGIHKMVKMTTAVLEQKKLQVLNSVDQMIQASKFDWMPTKMITQPLSISMDMSNGGVRKYLVKLQKDCLLERFAIGRWRLTKKGREFLKKVNTHDT